MTRIGKAFTLGSALMAGLLLLTGCAALRDLADQVAPAVPQPSLPANAEPLERIYDGGTKREGMSAEEWDTKSQRRITAAGAAHKILVYGVSSGPGSEDLTVRIKGDPTDTQLIADVEQYVVPVALRWAPTVTVIIDPSLCGIADELRDDTPLCETLNGD